MRIQTISAICLLATGLVLGLFLSPVKWLTAPEGDLMAREKVVEAGMNMEVDLRVNNRPAGSVIEWHAENGKFSPEVTQTDLKSVFTAPAQQGRVRIWVDVREGQRLYRDVASTYLDVSRQNDNAGEGPAIPALKPAGGSTAVVSIRPSISFITVPPYDDKGGPTTSAEIEGQVDGLKTTDEVRIILYAKTGNSWWIQPLAAAPNTLLDQNGHFFSWTHTGTSYGALLVRKDFKAPIVVDGMLPAGNDVLARKEVNGRRKGE